MVKAGLGIGLLTTINILNSVAAPLNLPCDIALPLYLTALTERLKSKPVRVVYDFMCSVLGDGNPWLGRDAAVAVQKGEFVDSYNMLLNS